MLSKISERISAVSLTVATLPALLLSGCSKESIEDNQSLIELVDPQEVKRVVHSKHGGGQDLQIDDGVILFYDVPLSLYIDPQSTLGADEGLLEQALKLISPTVGRVDISVKEYDGKKYLYVGPLYGEARGIPVTSVVAVKYPDVIELNEGQTVETPLLEQAPDILCYGIQIEAHSEDQQGKGAKTPGVDVIMSALTAPRISVGIGGYNWTERIPIVTTIQVGYDDPSCSEYRKASAVLTFKILDNGNSAQAFTSHPGSKPTPVRLKTIVEF